MLAKDCLHPALWSGHTAWVIDCTNVTRTEVIEFLVSLSAFLTFALAGVALALRGHRIMRFVPAVLAAFAEAWYVPFPFVPGAVPLIYGWRPPSPPFFFSHHAVGALVVGLLLCLSPALVRSDTSRESTSWPRPQILAQLLVGVAGYAILDPIAPRGSEILLLTALLLGVTTQSRKDIGYSVGWVILPAVVLTLGEILYLAVLTTEALRAVGCCLIAAGAGASVDVITSLIARASGKTAQGPSWDAPVVGL